MRISWKFTSIIIVTFLCGCVIQSSQLNGLLKLIERPTLDLSITSWKVSYADYESIVYAVSVPEGILFSNKAGDQVFFDGWVVRKIRGLGRHQLSLDIYDDANLRTFKRANRVLSHHSCNEWAQQKSLEVTRYSQYCSDKEAYKNSILLKKNGEISIIRQIVDERYTAIVLSKLK